MKLFHLYQRVNRLEADAIQTHLQCGDAPNLQFLAQNSDAVWLNAKNEYAEAVKATFQATPAERAIARVNATGYTLTAVSDTIVHIRTEDGSFAWFALADSVPPFNTGAQRADALYETTERMEEWFNQQERIPATKLPTDAAGLADAHALCEDGIFADRAARPASMFQIINAALQGVVIECGYVWTPQFTTLTSPAMGSAWYDRALTVFASTDAAPVVTVCRCIDGEFAPNGKYLLRCKNAPAAFHDTQQLADEAALVTALKAFYPKSLHRAHH